MDYKKQGALLVLIGVGIAIWSGGPGDLAAEPGTGLAHRTSADPPASRAAPQGAVGVSLDAAESSEEQAVWHDTQLLVQLQPGVDARRVARDHGAELKRSANHADRVALIAQDAAGRDALVSALNQDPRVAAVSRMGLTYGASKGGSACEKSAKKSGCTSSARATDLQWHLDAVGAPYAGDTDLSSVVIAVLDTGVAYEDYSADGADYVQIPGLAGISFVSPYDFVNGDAHPNDDHQHGTHIACVIACEGDIEGVAAGASLMPLKVLDGDNVGTELDLIDAIDHATANGADIINMSLAFSEGYVPSRAMRESLDAAADAGVVMLAAAGNQGVAAALYPSASPLVIAVGASQLDKHGDLEATWYSNESTNVDFMAPGGNLDDDMDGDGYVDGILAETISPTDPTDVGWWFYAGTSQATAIATGAAAHIIAAGETDPQRISQALQYSASDDYTGTDFKNGMGAGNLDIGNAIKQVGKSPKALTVDQEYHVAILPYLAPKSKKKVTPKALITAVDGNGDPAVSVTLIGSVWNVDGRTAFKCTTNSDGECTISGATVNRYDSSGAEAALAWGFAVDAAEQKTSWSIADHPGSAFFVTDGLVLITEALSAEGLLDNAPLAIEWETGTDDLVGSVLDAYAVADLASGHASRAEALLFTPATLDGLATIEDVELDLDGLGLVTDPLGVITVHKISLNGSGLVTDPLGLTGLRLIALSGTGLVTDPLGFKPRDLLSFGGAGLVTDPLGFTGQPVLLSMRAPVDGTLAGYALGGLLDEAGFVNEDGYPGASALMSSGAVGLDYDAVELASGAMDGVAY